MYIAFLRHGHALDVFTAKVSQDSMRPLSDLGKKQVLSSLIELKNLGFTPEIIISSPYRRAVETAKIAALHFDKPEIVHCEELTGQDTESALSAISLISSGRNALIVGHQPLLKFMASHISEEENIELPTAGFALIDVDDKKEFKGKLKYNRKNGEYN
ncbi:MAG: hypothetical protein Fur0012_14270 [Elusimicrobiota bacterium]